jgi:hypothetical protein
VSRVEFRNLHHRSGLHRPTSRAGDLRLHDRVVARGKGAKQTVTTTFDAIFTFDDPLICAVSDVPEHGGYFMQDDGNAEVTQLIADFPSEEERAAWLTALFDNPPG